MNQTETAPEIIVYLCRNSLADIGSFPVQWTRSGIHIRVRLVPCSGKIDIQYMFHALEAGKAGVCVITCPHGECTLTQGNYRADIRVRSLKKLLVEIGLDEDCVTLIHAPSDATVDSLKNMVDNVATAIGRKSTVNQ
jgi:coenzyme F420-reducing hydrogenase delta subunit